MPALGRIFRWGTLPVLVASVLFASLHYHGEVRQQDPNYLLFMISGNALATLLTVAVALVIARRVRGATAADLGFVPEKFLVSPPAIDRTLSEYLVHNGETQLAISETQKFGHVTYFWIST